MELLETEGVNHDVGRDALLRDVGNLLKMNLTYWPSFQHSGKEVMKVKFGLMGLGKG